jgi:glycosyltransferase involved in cell wall biosynthesis
VNEGLSLALLEAMSSGLPAIACRNTGADDCILSGTNGLLLSGSSVDGLADAIQWSYEHRDESAEMGRRARNTIEERFTLEHYVERLIGLYERSSG